MRLAQRRVPARHRRRSLRSRRWRGYGSNSFSWWFSFRSVVLGCTPSREQLNGRAVRAAENVQARRLPALSERKREERAVRRGRGGPGGGDTGAQVGGKRHEGFLPSSAGREDDVGVRARGARFAALDRDLEQLNLRLGRSR